MSKLQRNSLVYRCIAKDGSTSVAKLLPGGASYPLDLYQEAVSKGLAPAILNLTAETSYPGGFRLLETEELASSSGWEQLHRFSGDMNILQKASNSALTSLHSCLSGTAVHGDIRPPNIFVR